MKGKYISPSHSSSKTKLRKYSLRNRSNTSNYKDFDKLFEEMKKNVINDIVNEVESKFNEHKEKFVNFINNYKINEATQTMENEEEKKVSKNIKTKKKTEKNISSTESTNEVETKSKSVQSLNKKDKKEKGQISKLNKKNKKDALLLSTPEPEPKVGDDKSQITSPEINSTEPKISKKTKNKNGDKKGNETEFIGKKRKKENENPTLVFNSEPNFDLKEDEKKIKRTKSRKTSYKRKTK